VGSTCADPTRLYRKAELAVEISYRRLDAEPEVSSPKAEILDVELLQQLWGPWLTLSATPGAHPLAGNAAWLWSNSQRLGADDDYARPWSAQTASGGLRGFVIQQARSTDHLGVNQAGATRDFRAFSASVEEWVYGSGLRRLQAVGVLGALTATASFPTLEIPDPESRDVIKVHTAYEIARGLRLRDPFDDVAGRVMHAIAAGDHDPRLALMAVVSQITILLRFNRDAAAADSYLSRADELRRVAASEGGWLNWHLINNLHRAKALLALRHNNDTEVVAELAAATEAAGEASAASLDDYAKHMTLQGSVLLAGAKIRFEIRRGCEPARVAEEIEFLMKHASYDIEQQPVLGDLFSGAGMQAEAVARYRAAAQGGAVQGADAAYRAYRCSVSMGDVEGAMSDLYLLRDLDPRADVDHYFNDLSRNSL